MSHVGHCSLVEKMILDKHVTNCSVWTSCFIFMIMGANHQLVFFSKKECAYGIKCVGSDLNDGVKICGPETTILTSSSSCCSPAHSLLRVIRKGLDDFVSGK